MKASSERQRLMAGQLAYFTKGQQQGQLNYSQVAAMKRKHLVAALLRA